MALTWQIGLGELTGPPAGLLSPTWNLPVIFPALRSPAQERSPARFVHTCAMDHFTAKGVVHFKNGDTWYVGTGQLRQAYRAIGLAFVDDTRFMSERGAICAEDQHTVNELKRLGVIKKKARKASVIEVRHESRTHPSRNYESTHTNRASNLAPNRAQPHKVLDYLLLERGVPLSVVPKMRGMPDTRSMAAAHVRGDKGLSVYALAPTSKVVEVLNPKP